MSDKPPVGPVTETVNGREYKDAICPECGDQAFFVDNAEDGKPDAFGFSCDSCDYIFELGDYPEHDARLLSLARDLGYRQAKP